MYPYLSISLLILFLFYLLFIFSFADDNALTSWYWVFKAVEAKTVYLILILSLPLAYLFSKTFLWKRHQLAFLFIFSFFVGVVFWKIPEFNVDASRYFIEAKYMEQYGVWTFMQEWGRELYIWLDLPTVPFVYGLIFRFLGESRIHIQLFGTLLFSCTIVLTYLIGKKLWNNDIGFCAGFLLLGFPYLLTQVPLMLLDIPAMFFLALSVFTCINAAQERSNKWIIPSSLAIFLAFFTKFYNWVMLSVIPVIFFIYFKKEKTKKVFYRGITVMLLSTLLIGIVAALKFDILLEQANLLQSYQLPAIKMSWKESHHSTFLFQIHPLITLAAMYSVYVALRKRDPNYLIVIWPVVLFLLMGVERIRYIMPAFPAVALMAAYGLKEMRSEGIQKFTASAIVFSSLVIAILAYLPFLENFSAVNLERAGEYVDSLGVEGVEVFTVFPERTIYNPAISVPLLDLCTKSKIFYAPRVVLPPLEEIEHAIFRFTWEYRNPDYYNYRDMPIRKAVIVISRSGEEPYPNYLRKTLEGYKLSKVFDTVCVRPYEYETIAKIYVKN